MARFDKIAVLDKIGSTGFLYSTIKMQKWQRK